MNQYFVLLVSLFLLTSCTRDVLDEDPALNYETHTTEFRGNDVPVCHINGKGEYSLIYINGNAVNAHINHGDVVILDADGDGFATEENDCFPWGDCDDLDPSIYPGAPELCGDGIDNNCNDHIDEGCDPVYDCPCFSYQEALDYAMATAIEYKDEVCTMGSRGFTSTQGPFWGVTQFFFSNYCTDFNGNYIMLSPSQVQEGKLLVQAVQAEVQAAYCGD